MDRSVLLGRSDTLKTNFVNSLKSVEIFNLPHHLWTFEKNINFIHSIVHDEKKVQCVIQKRTCYVSNKSKLDLLPLVKKAIENIHGDDEFYDALINELYRDAKGASMLAIELNILFGFGFSISKIQKYDDFFIFDLQKNHRYKNLLNFMLCK